MSTQDSKALPKAAPKTLAKAAPKPAEEARTKLLKAVSAKKEKVPKPSIETTGAVRSTQDVANDILLAVRTSLDAKPKRAKRILTDEQKANLSERLVKARAARVAKRALAA